jgi:hypothetical protein
MAGEGTRIDSKLAEALHDRYQFQGTERGIRKS